MGLLLLIPAALLVYSIYGIYYRLYLSPIAHIPGPKLAAITRLSVSSLSESTSQSLIPLDTKPTTTST